MKLKLKLYKLFVERDSFIRDHYIWYKRRLLYDGLRGGIHKIGYLLFCYFQKWFLRRGMKKDNTPYLKGSESSLSFLRTPEQFAQELDAFNVVSFDIFDTLLLRPFAVPADLFHLVGAELGYINFAALRRDMEALCRDNQINSGKTREVTLEQIYALLERQIGVPALVGIETELRAERDLLYANPYMKRVFEILRKKGKRIIAVSDTYLPSDFIRSVLENNGYCGMEELFISSERGCGKYDGSLFDQVKTYLGPQPRCVHIGENARSDFIMPKNKGFSAVYYPNVNLTGIPYRSKRQSRVVGSAYAGIVNAHLHNGSAEYTPFYEYGFIFGGLFVMGYCRHIREYARQGNIDRVLFLSRDGDILKQAYDLLYPDNDSRYVHWSRAAAAKLGADYFRFDYLRRFLFQKTGGKHKTGEIIEAMDLLSLREILLQKSGLSAEDLLDEKNCKQLEMAILDCQSQVLACYEDSHIAARNYFKEVLGDCRRACTVDVGWAGSGGVILSYLVEKRWNLGCELTGLIAGVSSPHTDQPDSTEALLQSGKVNSYLFSQSHNRDYWETYDPPGKGNVSFFEALLASPTPGFSGFALPDTGTGYKLIFYAGDERASKNAHEIQSGILDFVREYAERFGRYNYMMNVSGSDAFAPFAAAMNNNGAYFRRLFRNCAFELGVAEKSRSMNRF